MSCLDGQALFGLGQGLLGGLDLLLHAQTLVSEGVAGYVVALLGMEPDQASLLGFELGDEGGLSLSNLNDGLVADSGQGFYGRGALGDILSRELDGALTVVALDGLLDQLWPDTGTHGAGHTARPADAEEVRIAAAALATREAIDQPVAAVAAEDAAAQVVLADRVALPSRVLFIEQGLYAVEGVLVN